MKIKLFGAVTLAFCLFFATGATAGIVYNGSLASPGGTPASPGFYNGSGSQNVGFNVFTNGNLELGLSAIIRGAGPALESNDTYYVPKGVSTVKPPHSAWGITFSVDTQLGQAGSGSAFLSDYSFLLRISDINTGITTSFDPLNFLGDNLYFGNTAPGAKTTTRTTGSEWGFQNSEAPSFPFIAGPLSFDVNALHTYKVNLTATSLNPYRPGGAVTILVDVQANANQTPEPATFGLIGSALFGLGLVGSRRLRRSK